MLRKLLIAALLMGIFAPSAAAGRVVLTPGVTYERQLVFTPHGPEVMHVMTAPRPGGLYALKPILSNNLVLGRETVTSMERRTSTTATVGGVNADLFTWNEGLPSGMFMESGVLKTPPHPKRSTVGITDDGRLLVQRVAMLGTWQGSSQRRPLNGLNQRPGPEGVSLFTPAWGRRRLLRREPSRSRSIRFRPQRLRLRWSAPSRPSSRAAELRSRRVERSSLAAAPPPAGSRRRLRPGSQ